MHFHTHICYSSPATAGSPSGSSLLAWMWDLLSCSIGFLPQIPPKGPLSTILHLEKIKKSHYVRTWWPSDGSHFVFHQKLRYCEENVIALSWCRIHFFFPPIFLAFLAKWHPSNASDFNTGNRIHSLSQLWKFGHFHHFLMLRHLFYWMCLHCQ